MRKPASFSLWAQGAAHTIRAGLLGLVLISSVGMNTYQAQALVAVSVPGAQGVSPPTGAAESAGLGVAGINPAATPIPVSLAAPCYPGTGWTWTYGSFQPALAAAIQKDLAGLGLSTTVKARQFGETDSCGAFEAYAVDLTIAVKSQLPIGKGEQQEIAGRLYPLLEQRAKPKLGRVTLEFPTSGDRLVLNGPPDQSPQPTRATAAREDAGILRRVYVVVYDPMLSNGQLLHEYMGWFDHAYLTQGTVDLFASASNGYVQYEVVATTVITDEWPVTVDGFRYTEEEYLAVLGGELPPHEPSAIDYNAILNDPQLDPCGKLNQGEIDDLWLYGAPYFGMWESTLAGPGAFWYNSPPVPDENTCQRLMPIMGPSYERDLDCATHNFSHRTESTMTRVYGSWEQNRTLHNWDRFGLVLAQSPDYWYSGCGSGHYPPNGQSDYDYSNTSTVPCTCDDFANYPNLGDPQDTAQPVGCSAWDCDHTTYMGWWHGHLPANPACGPDTVANNWWNYFAVPALANDPPSGCAPTSLSIVGPALAEINVPQAFTATLATVTGTPPITFWWSATGQQPVKHVTGSFADTASFTWASAGQVTVAVTATFSGGSVAGSFTSEVTSTHLVTKRFSIVEGSDDAGPNPDCYYSTAHNEVYFGKCTSGQNLTSGFRFTEVSIPPHAMIRSAYLEFTVDGDYSNALTVVLFGEAAADAETFGIESRPTSRPLTSASTVWPIPSSDVWQMGSRRRTPDLSAIIQEVVDRADWNSGNSLVVITKNAGPTNPPNTQRRVFAYERYGNGQEVAELVVSYGELATEARFSANPLGGCAPLTVQFADESQGEVTGWLWSFGDGHTSTLPSPLHIYTVPAVYTVSLAIEGPGGSDLLTRPGYIAVYEPVDAQFVGSPLSGPLPLLVSFRNQSSGDYDTCTWTFGDGGSSSGCDNATHTYTSAGVYTVALTLGGPGGTDTLTRTDYITGYEPVIAGFVGSPTSGIAPLVVSFTNQSGGDYDTCAWAFGDGATSSSCGDPAHTYSEAGVYTVSLAVSGPGGADTEVRAGYVEVLAVYRIYLPLTGRSSTALSDGQQSHAGPMAERSVRAKPYDDAIALLARLRNPAQHR